MEKGEKFIVADGPFMGFNAVVVDVIRRETRGEIPEIIGIVEAYRCDVDIFGRITSVLIDIVDTPITKEALAKRLNGLRKEELKTLRAIINGKLGKRTISAEQQSRMQAGRSKKDV